jgi:hypothetical protein
MKPYPTVVRLARHIMDPGTARLIEEESISMSSLYQDYKNSTSQFQKWILKTSARKGLPNILNFLRVHVQNIVQNAATLRKQKAFFGDLKGALSNGRAAIKARKAVHLTKVNEIPKSVSPKSIRNI